MVLRYAAGEVMKVAIAGDAIADAGKVGNANRVVATELAETGFAEQSEAQGAGYHVGSKARRLKKKGRRARRRIALQADGPEVAADSSVAAPAFAASQVMKQAPEASPCRGQCGSDDAVDEDCGSIMPIGLELQASASCDSTGETHGAAHGADADAPDCASAAVVSPKPGLEIQASAIVSSDEDTAWDRWKQLSTKQLRKLCQRQGLFSSGGRADLVDRLAANPSAGASTDVAEPPQSSQGVEVTLAVEYARTCIDNAAGHGMDEELLALLRKKLQAASSAEQVQVVEQACMIWCEPP